jgi:hypothetical protein
MLRLFFHRNSLFMQLTFWAALALTLLYFWRSGWALLSAWQRFLFVACLFQILFSKVLVLYPWYPKTSAGPGIGLQFQKAIVPVSYLWLSLILWMWIKPMSAVLIAYNLLLLPMGAVACILIYFHRLDPDRNDPNPLSGSRPLLLPKSLTTPGLSKKAADPRPVS